MESRGSRRYSDRVPRKLRRPSHATIVAYTALLLAICGTAYAATQLPRNSVSSKQVKNRSLKGKDVKNNQLSGRQVKESTLAKVPDSDLLDGRDAADFLSAADAAGFVAAGAIRSGSADETATPAQVILDYPDLGIRVRTDGDADQDHSYFMENTRTAGNIVAFHENAPGSGATTPGGAVGFGATNRVIDFAIAVVDEPSKAVHFNCGFVPGGTVNCIGMRTDLTG